MSRKPIDHIDHTANFQRLHECELELHVLLFVYSIEDAKQKSEYDRMMKLAEEKKEGVRGTISAMRKQFKELLERNAQLPSHLQLDSKGEREVMWTMTESFFE